MPDSTGQLENGGAAALEGPDRDPRAHAAPGLSLHVDRASKRYGATQALREVSFSVRRGTIHGLVGANGAGKSTLMKMVQGAVRPSAGEVYVAGVKMTYDTPGEARRLGLGMVFQEFSVVPSLTVLDNLFLNAERKGMGGLLDVRAQRSEARGLFQRLGVDLDIDVDLERLSMAEQQIVEIAKALRLATSVLLLDEPSSALPANEVSRLYDIVKQIAATGVGIVLTTHHLNEIFDVCDEVTVLRDGTAVLNCPVSDTSLKAVVDAMVGGDYTVSTAASVPVATPHGQPLCVVDSLSVGDDLADVSFEVHPGEILGVAGLTGSGREVLVEALFGAVTPSSGRILIAGDEYKPSSPTAAIRHGVYLIPSDRLARGVVAEHSVEQNIAMSILRSLRSLWFLYDRRASRSVATDFVRELEIKTPSVTATVDSLSGGNQQKVVLSKALATDSRLLLLDEPTFGVDIKAADAIARHVRAFAEADRGVIWASSELNELRRVADRILVLVGGRVKTVLPNRPHPILERELLHAVQ